MPELPEVETTCTALKSFIVNRVIRGITVRCARLRYAVDAELGVAARQQEIVSLVRRSKYLLMSFKQGGGLLWHLGMSGSLRIEPVDGLARPHDHVIMHFADYNVHYHDPRRFGFVLLVRDFDDLQLLQALGPEPLSRAFSTSYLYQSLCNKRVGIKQAIMNNRIVVGVGNIYANESLFDAKIHPQHPSFQLSMSQCQQLTTSIKKILRQSIRQGGTTLRDFVNPSGGLGYYKLKLNVYGRQGLPCKSCGNIIQKIVIAQRSTYYCDVCQD